MNAIQIFPERTDKIRALSKLSSFTTDEDNTLYSLTVEMEGGDVINFYHPSKKEAEKFKIGETITYEMRKTKNEKGTTNKFESYKFKEDEKIVGAERGVVLLPFLEGKNIEDFVFIDIETVRAHKTLTTKSPLYKSWEYKRRYDEDLTAKDLKTSFNEKAPLFAEFAKVVCISVASIQKGKLKGKSYFGDDEKKILDDFSYDIQRKMKISPRSRLCGHSIIGFDIPFLYKRMIVNRVPVPGILDISFQKPWTLDEKYLDIATLWNATSFHRASLLNIAAALGLDNPKEKIDGSQVSEAYYGGRLNEIVEYCERDTLTVANIMNHMFGHEIISNE